MPTHEQGVALEATLRMVNKAANHVSRVAFTTGTRREYALRRHAYGEEEALQADGKFL